MPCCTPKQATQPLLTSAPHPWQRCGRPVRDWDSDATPSSNAGPLARATMAVSMFDSRRSYTTLLSRSPCLPVPSRRAFDISTHKSTDKLFSLPRAVHFLYFAVYRRCKTSTHSHAHTQCVLRYIIARPRKHAREKPWGGATAPNLAPPPRETDSEAGIFVPSSSSLAASDGNSAQAAKAAICQRTSAIQEAASSKSPLLHLLCAAH